MGQTQGKTVLGHLPQEPHEPNANLNGADDRNMEIGIGPAKRLRIMRAAVRVHACACSARAGQLLASCIWRQTCGGQCISLRCLSLIAANWAYAALSTYRPSA